MGKGSYCAGKSYFLKEKNLPKFRWVVLEISKKMMSGGNVSIHA